MSALNRLTSAPQMDQRMYDYLERKALKLQTHEVFDRIRSAIGVITDSTNREIYKSGCFVSMREKVYFVTTTPDLPSATDTLTVHHTSGTYQLKDPVKLVTEKVKELQLKVFECYGQLSSQLTFLDFAPQPSIFKEGTKVYYGGVPLSSKDLVFHRGTISSERYDEKVHTFTIDGSIVQGFSGGPVVMQDNGKIYLVGVIKSQVVIPSENLSKDPSPAIQELYKSAVSNRSTGVGKAIDAQHCYELIDWRDMPSSISKVIKSLSGFPDEEEEFVGRKKGGINTRSLKDILKKHGYAKIREGAGHTIWAKSANDNNVVQVVRGKTMGKYTAEAVLKDISEWENLDYNTLKQELS